MSLMEQIKSKQLAARKAGAPYASLYTTLLGEAIAIGKNAGNRETTDAEVVAVVKKFIKNVNDTITALNTRKMDDSVFVTERELLEEFLPKQLSADELTDIAATTADMPSFMKHLKTDYAGRYDGQHAQIVAKLMFTAKAYQRR